MAWVCESWKTNQARLFRLAYRGSVDEAVLQREEDRLAAEKAAAELA